MCSAIVHHFNSYVVVYIGKKCQNATQLLQGKFTMQLLSLEKKQIQIF